MYWVPGNLYFLYRCSIYIFPSFPKLINVLSHFLHKTKNKIQTSDGSGSICMQICCIDLTSLRNSKEEKETHKVYFGWNCVISLIWCLFSLVKWHSVPFSPDSVFPAQGVETCLFHWTDLSQDKEYQLWVFDIHLELFVPLVNYYLPLKGRRRKQIAWRRVRNDFVSLPSFLDRLLHVIYIWKDLCFSAANLLNTVIRVCFRGN